MTRKVSKLERVFRGCLKLAAIVWVIRLGLNVDPRGLDQISWGRYYMPKTWPVVAAFVLFVVWVFGQFWPVRSDEVPTNKTKKEK